MKLNVAMLGLFLLAGNHVRGEEEQGWYSFEFRTGGSLVARLSKVEGNSYYFLYQGAILRVEKDDLKGLRRVGSPEETSQPSRVELTAPTSENGRSTAGKESPAREEQIRDAIEQLGLLEDPRSDKAYRLLSANLPKARDLLHESLLHPSAIVRGRLVKLLGQGGTAREDLPAVSGRLNDPQPEVRLAAVLAVRNLGPDGAGALRLYLATETVPNNLKMAIKTLHIWKDVQSVAPLVACMEASKEQTVVEFAERALTYLTGQKLGSEPAAWRAWLTEEERKQEEQKVLRSGELQARDREIKEAKAREKASRNEADKD
jgi:hypothetical protein